MKKSVVCPVFGFLLVLSACVCSIQAAYADSEQSGFIEPGFAEVGRWHFSVSAGLGNKSNPLLQGDDFPLYILPSVYYYGEQLFFENGDLGYSFVQRPEYVFSAIARLNEEVVHFVDWHPANILVTQFINRESESDGQKVEQSITDESLLHMSFEDDFAPGPAHINFKQLAERKWSLDAGLQFDWFIDDSASFRLRALADASLIHDGKNFNFEYQKKWFNGAKWHMTMTLGTDWLSQQLTEYYYGISARDGVDPAYYYQPDSAWLPYIKLTPHYRLNENWRLVSLIKYQHLPDTLSKSPIVEKNYRLTWFAGVNYAF